MKGRLLRTRHKGVELMTVECSLWDEGCVEGVLPKWHAVSHGRKAHARSTTHSALIAPRTVFTAGLCRHNRVLWEGGGGGGAAVLPFEAFGLISLVSRVPFVLALGAVFVFL